MDHYNEFFPFNTKTNFTLTSTKDSENFVEKSFFTSHDPSQLFPSNRSPTKIQLRVMVNMMRYLKPIWAEKFN